MQVSRTAALHDRVAQAVIDRYDGLPGRAKPQGKAWTVLAGIVAERKGELEVIALATGTRCVGLAAMVAGGGQVMHDCHAEVLCRRAFHRFLLAEMAWQVGSQQEGHQARKPILERLQGEELQFGLAADLHFYVSTLPCGECTLVPLQSSKEGTLARKLTEETEPVQLQDRNRTGAKPSRGMPTDPKADGIDFHRDGVLRYKSGRSDTRPDSQTVCYSCSDKLCRWNRLGWEGALLSRLLKEPLRMQSVVLGGCVYDAGFAHHALFGRGPPSASAAPTFCHTSVQFHASREAVEALPGFAKVSTAGLSLVWSAEPTGRTEALPNRSISNNVPGFYDILIGHTGQRQGLRNDRQAKRVAVSHEVDSWVSPLCKKLMAQDVLSCLRHMLGDEALADWILKTDDSERKRRRLSPALGAMPPAVGERAHAHFPSYAWLKEALSSGSFRAARAAFHASEPFCHWGRKQTMVFKDDAHGVDGFAVPIPPSREVKLPLAR
ncbi:unnamed protein product [Effrenium voratum]|uniref:tRNA-specific adenosine deaminase 1 n=1 Tax=Effrenium voratum TaxID=2562239 RepID=A0AA36N7G6_9DINO|nr:unnamed protein product [Effrenium voratum]